jgi:hypothetical protein
MSSRLVLLLLSFTLLSAPASPRAWRSADGSKSIQGTYVKHDSKSVTILGESYQEMTFDLTKLHAEDVEWLKENHSPNSRPSADNAFFDTLSFKDSRETALAKLKASKLVEMTADETFIGRSGLNGIFRTRNKIGELDAFLFFDWTPAGKLMELSLQTETIKIDEYKTKLQPSWEEFIKLLSALYGEPVQKSDMPAAETLQDGSLVPSHLWRLETGGSVLLGTAQDGKKYQLVVRFTEKKVKVVELR